MIFVYLSLSEPAEAPTGVTTTVMNSTVRVKWNEAQNVRGLLQGYKVQLVQLTMVITTVITANNTYYTNNPYNSYYNNSISRNTFTEKTIKRVLYIRIHVIYKRKLREFDIIW